MVGEGEDCKNAPGLAGSSHCESKDLVCTSCPESTDGQEQCQTPSGKYIIYYIPYQLSAIPTLRALFPKSFCVRRSVWGVLDCVYIID